MSRRGEALITLFALASVAMFVVSVAWMALVDATGAFYIMLSACWAALQAVFWEVYSRRG